MNKKVRYSQEKLIKCEKLRKILSTITGGGVRICRAIFSHQKDYPTIKIFHLTWKLKPEMWIKRIWAFFG